MDIALAPGNFRIEPGKKMFDLGNLGSGGKNNERIGPLIGNDADGLTTRTFFHHILKKTAYGFSHRRGRCVFQGQDRDLLAN